MVGVKFCPLWFRNIVGGYMKKLYRSIENRKIAGVCGGLAEYFDLDPVIVRIVFVLSVFVGGLLVYLVIWIMVPFKDKNLEIKCDAQTKNLYLSTRNRKIAGVCGGLGEYFGQDPTFFRIIFILLTFMGGIGIIAYVLFWFLIPPKADSGFGV